jgi:hypothetical protein
VLTNFKQCFRGSILRCASDTYPYDVCDAIPAEETKKCKGDWGCTLYEDGGNIVSEGWGVGVEFDHKLFEEVYIAVK